jgi:hypothetical protein
MRQTRALPACIATKPVKAASGCQLFASSPSPKELESFNFSNKN